MPAASRMSRAVMFASFQSLRLPPMSVNGARVAIRATRLIGTVKETWREEPFSCFRISTR